MKRHCLLLGFISCLILILTACRKDNREIDREGKEYKGLDLNFSFDEKPDAGMQLIAHLYYAQEESEPFLDKEPDRVLKHTLTAKEIAEGLTLTFEGKITSPFAYVMAYVDVDADGELSEGDIAVAYGGEESRNVREVIRGVATAENVSLRKFATMKMDRRYSTQRPPLEMLITFPAPPLSGVAFEIGLYYAEAADESVMDRAPDIVRQYILTEEDIADGLAIVFEDLEDAPYLFARAYVDMDADGQISHGDIAMFYGGISINDVLQNRALPQNIGPLANVSLTMSVWHANETGPLIDIDGNEYTTFVHGNKEWMAENLKVTRYRTGAPIPAISSSDNTAWSAASAGAYTVYPFASTPPAYPVASEEDIIAQFGLLYNGHAVMDPRELAPVGWRVATDEDYKELELFAGIPPGAGAGNIDAIGWRGDAAITSKFRSETVWASPGTNEFGFTAKPGGQREVNGSFVSFRTRASFWTSTPSGNNTFRRMIDTGQSKVGRSAVARTTGHSVRCVRDL